MFWKGIALRGFDTSQREGPSTLPIPRRIFQNNRLSIAISTCDLSAHFHPCISPSPFIPLHHSRIHSPCLPPRPLASRPRSASSSTSSSTPSTQTRVRRFLHVPAAFIDTFVQASSFVNSSPTPPMPSTRSATTPSPTPPSSTPARSSTSASPPTRTTRSSPSAIPVLA